MAILINDIIQGIGAEIIDVSEVDSTTLEPGVHILNAERTILGNTFEQWTIIVSYDQVMKATRAQVWIPMAVNGDTIEMFFIRTSSMSGGWSNFKKYSAGDKLITLEDFESNVFSLVDNTDPLNPKIKQDDTKADKPLAVGINNSIAALDLSGNLVSTEKSADWIDYYTIDANDIYLLELQFAKDYDDTNPSVAGYKGYGYAVFTVADVNYTIKDRNGTVIHPNQVTFNNWRGITIGSNSLTYVRTTETSTDITGVPQNAVVFNGVKEYLSNEGTSYVGSAIVNVIFDFQVDGISYSETRTLKILATYGKRNVWLEQGTGSNKYRLEATYVDPVTGVNPQFYNAEQIDAIVNRITIPGNHENQIMVFGNPAVAGDIYRWLDKVTTIADENNRTDDRIPTEKAIADYVDDQVQGKGIASFGYNQTNRRLTITKSDTSSLSTDLPLATPTIDGLMSKEDKEQIASLISDVSMLSGKARIVGNLGTNPTEAQVQNYWTQVKGSGMTPEEMVGSIILNLDQEPPVGHAWMYVQLADGTYHWIDKGADSVAIATNTQLGTVKGVAPGTGYNYHCNFINQVGSGIEYLNKTLTNTVDPTFTIKITGVDGAGNITSYDLTPKTGNTSKFLSKVEFTNSSVGDDIFRFDVTSFAAGEGEGYASVNSSGELIVNGYKTLREQVEYQLDNKVDKQGINIWSTDGFITVSGESPNFAISLNMAGSREVHDLTSILDGTTKQWDLNTLPVGEHIKGDVTFWYGDGRLIPGKDYTFNIVKDSTTGEIISKDLICLNDPAWNSSENRTLFAEVVKTQFLSDITGIANVSSGDGSIIYQKQGDTMELRVNDAQVLGNETQTINAPSESRTIITSGTVIEFLQSLSNNVKFLMDNTVWKNANTDKPLKIAFQSGTVTPETGVNKIQIDPTDLGQN